MTVGIVDTTVIVHYFRKHPNARAWVDSQSQALAVTSVTWLEVLRGAPNKQGMTDCKAILGRFDFLYLMTSDQDWAIEQIERYRFSHGLGMADCLVAAVAWRLQVPLYTHNLKDMVPLLGANLAIKPYP